ncbi:hypothetical protein WA026_013505 [Henosepilachna vigintioctopunctata]|uniref:GH18 domain-containing protein n=1 Tax=Henosepilachna vigintioctopunctata TaxID=420089 RepID=A0AAW1VD70_9CUCU
MWWKFKLFFAILVLSEIVHLASSVNVVCYFSSWTTYRPGNGKYNAANLPADLCTHVLYAFVGIDYQGNLVILDDWEAEGLKELQHLQEKKNENPKLKVMVSMGGWNEGSEKYSHVVSNSSLRKNLIDSILVFLNKFKFDGFDLDWEYPNQRGGSPEDVENLTLLLKELKEAFKPKNYTLSIAASGGVESASVSYNISAVGKIVDFINVMTFDYHGNWDSYVGHSSPLYPSHLDTGSNRLLNVNSGIEYWIQQGAPLSKIYISLASYGRCFTLANANNSSLYAPTQGPCRPGPYTREAGTVGYNEICELYSDYKRIWDDEQKVPHKIKDNQWIGYDDIESIKLKTEYAKSLGLQGFMVWSLDTDDFLGICGSGKYPLINSAKTAWNDIL